MQLEIATGVKVHCDKLIPAGSMAWTMDMNMFMVTEILKQFKLEISIRKITTSGQKSNAP